MTLYFVTETTYKRLIKHFETEPRETINFVHDMQILKM